MKLNLKQKIKDSEFKWIAIALGVVLIVIVFLHIFPSFVKDFLVAILRPFEKEYRPETLTFILTLIISLFSTWFTLKQYRILKMRDILKLHNLINRLYALLNFHIQSLLQSLPDNNDRKKSLKLSSERVITENEIQMIYELERLIYEHINIQREEEKRNFIIETTNIILDMHELIYCLNSIYKSVEAQQDKYSIDSEDIKRFNKILDDIDKYKKILYVNTDLKKIEDMSLTKIRAEYSKKGGGVMISVVMPVYNESVNIVDAINALYRNSVLPDEVIVIDGGSTDNTVQLIKEKFPQVIVFNNPRKNAAAGRNVGINVAQGDIIAFTDGDCIVDDYWIENILKAFENNNIDGLGGKVLIAEPINHIEEFWGNLAWKLIMNFGDEPYNVDKCTLNDAFVTANCAYKRELLFKLEGFSNWFANNAEDVDFCWRAIKSGAKLMYTPDVQIHAHNVTTIKDVAKKSFRNGYSSSKLQKKYGSKINFDPNIYKMLGRNLIGLIKCEKDASLNVLELICHLTGKYYGSIKVRVINI